jgi:hypothetical protein
MQVEQEAQNNKKGISKDGDKEIEGNHLDKQQRQVPKDKLRLDKLLMVDKETECSKQFLHSPNRDRGDNKDSRVKENILDKQERD